MSLLSKFTVTPLLYAVGVLMLVAIGLSWRLAIVGGDLDTAVAEKATANETVKRVATERDAWKERSEGLTRANSTCSSSIESLTVTLDRQQKAYRAQQAANAKAVAAARADAADADAALKHFTGQFQAESRRPPCAAALAALDSACPAMEGY